MLGDILKDPEIRNALTTIIFDVFLPFSCSFMGLYLSRTSKGQKIPPLSRFFGTGGIAGLVAMSLIRLVIKTNDPFLKAIVSGFAGVFGDVLVSDVHMRGAMIVNFALGKLIGFLSNLSDGKGGSGDEEAKTKNVNEPPRIHKNSEEEERPEDKKHEEKVNGWDIH
jgi:hypothetical protein|nr:MAG TPA: hypothetical protein [Caudoviricetes sp.]